MSVEVAVPTLSNVAIISRARRSNSWGTCCATIRSFPSGPFSRQSNYNVGLIQWRDAWIYHLIHSLKNQDSFRSSQTFTFFSRPISGLRNSTRATSSCLPAMISCGAKHLNDCPWRVEPDPYLSFEMLNIPMRDCWKSPSWRPVGSSNVWWWGILRSICHLWQELSLTQLCTARTKRSFCIVQDTIPDKAHKIALRFFLDNVVPFWAPLNYLRRSTA